MANGPAFGIADAPSADDESRPGDLLDVVIGLDRMINSLTAARSSALELARREGAATGDSALNQRAFRAEVAAALHVTERGAENLIGYAGMLVDDLPATLAKLATGEISYRHAIVIADAASGLNSDDKAALEEIVVDRAGETTESRLKAVARMARERLHPESIEERQVSAREGRGVWLDDEADGMSTLSFTTPSVQAHAIFNRLTSAARGLRLPGDTRTLDQRRADILGAVLLAQDGGGLPFGVVPGEDDSDNFVKWFRGISAEVVVTVPVLTLLGKADSPATLDGIVPIDAQTARILVGGSTSFTRVLTHPETGVTLSVGRKRYKVPKDLRRYLEIRDVVCRFPGCFHRAAHCDIDHTFDWQYGGETRHANLAHLCRGHHTLKGETEWRVAQSPDGSGVMTWTSPAGRNYRTFPHAQLSS